MAYNITEIFAVEGMLDYGFELESDVTELTNNLEEFNSVAPDISRVLAFGDVSFVYSPIYGKAAVLGSKIVNFDVYGKFGMGIAQTKDDPGKNTNAQKTRSSAPHRFSGTPLRPSVVDSV